MYRPQFAYPLTPAPCEDQTCMFSFDKTNLPALTGSLAAGARTGRIPLKVDKDAAFWLRAEDSQGDISYRLEEPSGNALSDSENTTNSSNYMIPNEYSRTSGAGFVAFESGAGGIFVPPSGTFLLYLYNNTSGSILLSTVAINLVGVKRYTGEACS